MTGLPVAVRAVAQSVATVTATALPAGAGRYPAANGYIDLPYLAEGGVRLAPDTPCGREVLSGSNLLRAPQRLAPL
ncbi:hypothetical protein Slala03_80900 [Streptomyces lavendulae subsp. lavendulae]|nr:hypothetical protein Slala03_80900 [Streptomyces lavendulae subsp. lavendulae]